MPSFYVSPGEMAWHKAMALQRNGINFFIFKNAGIRLSYAKT